MNDRHPGALMISLTLHAAVAGLMFLLSYAAELSQQPTTKVFVLVAGEGDNLEATAAPALGKPGGIKVDLPEPPVATPATPTPKPAEAVPAPEPSPVTPAPQPKPVPKPPADPKLNIVKDIKQTVRRADAKTKREIDKERADEAKRLSKEEFDRENKKKNPPTPTKIAKADGVGIPKGVAGGSPDNKKGGQSGTALSREDGPVMVTYFAMLKDRLRTALEKPPGLSDSLVTVVHFDLLVDGTLSGARITKSSGNVEFDSAVMAAIAATHMPARPDGKSEPIDIPFRMKEPTGAE